MFCSCDSRSLRGDLLQTVTPTRPATKPSAAPGASDGINSPCATVDVAVHARSCWVTNAAFLRMACLFPERNQHGRRKSKAHAERIEKDKAEAALVQALTHTVNDFKDDVAKTEKSTNPFWARRRCPDRKP